ncbi:MAG: hypothetical protein VYA71_07485, partial [Pseudomonadota bacterium]|nr:hypothetical protein [Pseudomonadota bacterium]
VTRPIPRVDPVIKTRRLLKFITHALNRVSAMAIARPPAIDIVPHNRLVVAWNAAKLIGFGSGYLLPWHGAAETTA